MLYFLFWWNINYQKVNIKDCDQWAKKITVNSLQNSVVIHFVRLLIVEISAEVHLQVLLDQWSVFYSSDVFEIWLKKMLATWTLFASGGVAIQTLDKVNISGRLLMIANQMQIYSLLQLCHYNSCLLIRNRRHKSRSERILGLHLLNSVDYATNTVSTRRDRIGSQV